MQRCRPGFYRLSQSDQGLQGYSMLASELLANAAARRTKHYNEIALPFNQKLAGLNQRLQEITQHEQSSRYPILK
jgi:hypothetical protein